MMIDDARKEESTVVDMRNVTNRSMTMSQPRYDRRPQRTQRHNILKKAYSHHYFHLVSCLHKKRLRSITPWSRYNGVSAWMNSRHFTLTPNMSTQQLPYVYNNSGTLNKTNWLVC